MNIAKWGSTFLLLSDFKKLSGIECGKNITCYNLYVMILITTFSAQRAKSSGYYFQLLVY